MQPSIYSRYRPLQMLEINGRRTLAQRPIPPQTTYPDAVYHRLQGDETLDQLAERYYGRADLWWRIADANEHKFALDWKAGDTLMIPPVRVATRVPRR